VPTPADGVPGGTEQYENYPYYHQDDPERPQNRNTEQVPHHQEDDTKDDHETSSGLPGLLVLILGRVRFVPTPGELPDIGYPTFPTGIVPHAHRARQGDGTATAMGHGAMALVSQINAAWILQAVLTSTFSDPVALPRNEPNQR
jgi:hypothetical protein